MTPPDLQLRDIHLPPPVSWWPPAPGWWWLLAAAIFAIIVIALWRRLHRMRQQPSLRKEILRELGAVRSRFAVQGDASSLIRDLSVLLRRICLSLFPRAEVASLTGEAWLAFLDRQIGGDRFRNGPGHVLASAPYAPQAAIDAGACLALCEQWVGRIVKAAPRI